VQVPAALTNDDLERKKEKEREKKRRQKEKQKEKKAEENAQKQQEEAVRSEKERKANEEDEAKRVRAGLAVKKAENACDFCGTLVRRASDMFNRLDWKYCSSACVQKHQRELAAAAAMARLSK
jgi:hypothetical protein